MVRPHANPRKPVAHPCFPPAPPARRRGGNAVSRVRADGVWQDNAPRAFVDGALQDQDIGGGDDFIASNTIPLQSLQQGSRLVTLFDSKWAKLTLSTLFVQITMQPL